MKKLSFLLSFLFLSVTFTYAQEDTTSASERARKYLMAGDFNNAILILNRAITEKPEDIQLKKDLAFAYYHQRNFSRALEIIRPVTEGSAADVQSYQILGLIYSGIEEDKESEKMYRNALKKFPESGPLYNELGELLWKKKNFANAAAMWEKGIETDPNFSGNYYNAAKYHYFTADKVWGLIYGEIFINLESISTRTPEIKTLLLDGYKKLFSDPVVSKGQNTKNEFTQAYLNTMQKQSGLVANGVTIESLTALRTRFILDWFAGEGQRFPFRLFDLHQQLLKEGLFEAYNQWIFSSANDLADFQRWTSANAEVYSRFSTLQKQRVFKIPSNQYYK